MREDFEGEEVVLRAKHIRRYRRHVLVYACLVAVTALFSVVDGFVSSYPEELRVAVLFYQGVSVGVFLIVCMSLMLLYMDRAFVVLRYGVSFSTMALISTLTVFTGMQTDMDIMHGFVLLSSPLILFSWQERRHVWVNVFVSFLLVLVVKVVVETEGGVLFLPEDVRESARMATWFLALLLAMYLAYTLLSVDNNQMSLLRERKKVDDLLRNVMPEVIAERLKEEKGGSFAERHENVSVLFADLKGFTAWCHGREAQDTFEALNSLVHLFDDVVSRYGGEKIKTIGDGYMAAWGVPDACEDHALRAVRAGYGMVSALKGHPLYKRDGVSLRVGIHSGVVTAGIIGRDKFAYDLWGDTVNTASRMEQKSEPMKVTVSSETISLVGSLVGEVMESDEFSGKFLGKMEVKGKGELEIWQVNEKGEEKGEEKVEVEEKVEGEV